MAILDSVKKLASKVGADTNGRTIAEQINNINRHLDSTGSRDIAEGVSKFADKEDGTAILKTKTITENGTYKASDDNANGYSSVTVNVENQIHSLYCSFSNISSGLLWSNNGEYDIPNSGFGTHLSYCILSDPATKVIVDIDISTVYEFTPGDSFEVFDYGQSVELVGDTIVPNDGKAYILAVEGGPGGTQYTIVKTNRDFVVTIS